MSIQEQITEFANKCSRYKDTIKTEEATKQHLVLPFLTILGYDIHDPFEVIPEFTADVGIKKGEKVDYANA